MFSKVKKVSNGANVMLYKAKSHALKSLARIVMKKKKKETGKLTDRQAELDYLRDILYILSFFQSRNTLYKDLNEILERV